jgi:hypothetical protein
MFRAGFLMAYLPGGGRMCRGEFEISVTQENFRKDFKVALDICGPMDDISSDKSGVLNGAASTSEDSARRIPLDEQHSMARLVRKPDLTSGDIKRIKAVAVDLLETLKAEKLRINHWRDKESTRDAVRLTIQDYLWSEQTGLPETYSEEDVRDKTEAVFVHVFRAYPTVPSPYYASMAS